MAVVFIYGPPAAGKLTVARELANMTGFKLFDNHTSIDWARAIYDFGDPRCLPLAENLRAVVFEEAAREGFGIIMTFTFTGWVAEPAPFAWCCSLFEQKGRAVCLVHLTASHDELMKRVVAEHRVARRKLTSRERLLSLLDGVDLDEPIPGRQSLQIDNSELSAAEAALRIAHHFDLPRI
jgi:hypothetical protein